MKTTTRGSLTDKQRDVDVLMATETKHYIRKEVWLPIVSKRQEKLNRHITYFTLTTKDLFDVKLLSRAGLIEKTSRGYPGLGFCERDDKVYSDVVRGLQWCRLAHKGSFEDMALRDENFSSAFGFDVINLDFTWVPFPDQESPMKGTWGAIKRVLEVQYQKGLSCDLFMTFRGSRQDTDRHSIYRVADLLDQNLSSGRGLSQFSQRVGHIDARRLLDEDYLTFLALGIPKLLAGEALGIGFQLSRSNVYSYPREGKDGSYHIVKFVFGLEMPSQSRLVFGAPPQLVTEYDSAVPGIFSEPVIDVVSIMQDDPCLTQALRNDMESLR